MRENRTLPLGPDLKTLWNRIPGWVRLTFFTALLLGAVTHLYVASNFLLNHDSVSNIFTDNDVITTGRWALKAFSALSTTFQIPVVITAIALLALSLTAVITVWVLGIRSQLGMVVTAALLVTFPNIACIFSYIYTADAYFLALLVNALAVVLAKKYRWGWLAAAAFMAVGCGVYQAFICYAIGLMLLDCILALLENEDLKPVILRGVRYMASIALAVLLYYVILQLVLHLRGVELSDYKGINLIDSTGLSTYLLAVLRSFWEVVVYFWNGKYLTPLWLWVSRVTVVMCAADILIVWKKGKLERLLPRTALLLAGILLLPIALNFITVLAANATAHELERYAFALMPVFAIRASELAAEHTAGERARKRAVPLLITAALCLGLVWNYFCISNVTYLRTQLCYENTYAMANRLAARVEALEEYDPSMPVVFMGFPDREQYAQVSEQFAQYDSLTGTNHSILIYEYTLRRFLPDCLGVTFQTAGDDQIAAIEGAGWLSSMPAYPHPECITVHDGVVVVKLGEGGAVRWSL